LKKTRIDKLLIEKGITDSRQKAQALILEGKVIANGQKIKKSGMLVFFDSEIQIMEDKIPFVSRGGLKLEAALKEFNISVKEKIAMDVGASTGGFTDCLLKYGAKKIYAVDVGYGQLAWSLRQDSRVIPLERENIRYMERSLVKENIDITTVDTSFVSLEKVLPAIKNFLGRKGEIIALIKPQFEVGKGEVGKGGVVREENKRVKVLEKIKTLAEGLELKVSGLMRSPIMGRKGNVEFLIYLRMKQTCETMYKEY
jgi:23S rRNA (cytidine1920-2'-O)/16S rRNA (cytidine1409-2'-O)-methyltransferase